MSRPFRIIPQYSSAMLHYRGYGPRRERRDNAAPPDSEVAAPTWFVGVAGGKECLRPYTIIARPAWGSWHYPREREYDAGTYSREASDDQLAIRLLDDRLCTVPATKEVDSEHAVGSESWVRGNSTGVEPHDGHVGIRTQVAATADDHCFAIRLQQHLHVNVGLVGDGDECRLRTTLVIIPVK